jgi:predicted nucleic-acid-binding Zn-ribbon protein
MKSGACPKCKSRELIVIDEATVPDHDSSNMVYPAAIASHYGPSGESGWMGDKFKRRSVGFAVHVCSKCAYSEMYAKDLELLIELATTQVANCRRTT